MLVGIQLSFTASSDLLWASECHYFISLALCVSGYLVATFGVSMVQYDIMQLIKNPVDYCIWMCEQMQMIHVRNLYIISSI